MSSCALGKDGQLLDASEIVFYHDADDDVPISGPSTSKGSMTARLGPPAQIIAGSRRPQRTLRPSTKVRDPNNVESARSAGKRKAADKPTVRRVTRKIALSDSDKENDNLDVGDDDYPPLVEVDDSDDECEQPHDDHVGGDTDIDTGDDADEAYLRTKSMGDTDRNVSASCVPSYLRTHSIIQASFRTQSDRTADVRTIFERIQDHVNADTGVTESGHLCRVCK
jgi:hypothetical protein